VTDSATALTELRDALATGDEAAVSGIVQSVVGDILGSDSSFPTDTALEMLGLLFNKRSFASVARLGDALLQTGIEDPRVRGYYAMALAEEGFLTPAESIAEGLKADAVEDPAERAWAQGFLGLIRARFYVQATGMESTRRQQFLRNALAAHNATYLREPNEQVGHGIQLVGLLARAGRDGWDPGNWGDPRAIAAKVATAVADSSRPADLTVAVKAAVTLEDLDAAARAAERLVADDRVEAYELNALLWDLANLWGLSESDELGAPIIGLLKTGLLQRPDFSHVELSPAQAEAAVEGLEKVFGKDGVVTLRWYKNGLDRSRSVTKVEDRSGRPMGTGFLVPGDGLHPSLAGQALMITNNHVIAAEPHPRIGQLRPGDAIVRFQALEEEGSGIEAAVTEIVFESPVTELDASVVRLDRTPEDLIPYRIATDMPERGTHAKVYVIGHPRGGTLSYSIDDNVLLDHDDQVLHYRSPTEPGSSGSPLFNRDWDLIGLHSRGNDSVPKLHGDEGTYATNVGFRITALQAAIGAALG
jgi:V8-like Glu-specific endopeptidase